jgi:LPXTG-motif cell wall-anchored protein
VQISRFVSMMSVDGSGVSGTTRTCLASVYWPVLDPLGTSLPTSPFFLSNQASSSSGSSSDSGATTLGLSSSSRYLCVGQSQTFGSTSWATVLLDLDKTDRTFVEAVYIEFDNAAFDETVFFVSFDPTTGKASTLPAGAKNVWWSQKYPFLNFRDLSGLLATAAASNMTAGDVITEPVTSVPVVGSRPVDYAVALTPGAVGLTGTATVTFNARIVNADNSLGGRVTLRSLIHLDKLLSDRDILGLSASGSSFILPKTGESTYIALLATGGLLVGVVAIVVIFVSVDTSKPLPRWIPNAAQLREVLLAGNALLRPFIGKNDEETASPKKKSTNGMVVEGISIPNLA